MFRAPAQEVPFTKSPEANALINDMHGHPHAFVLGCVMDRQIKAERAWALPYRFSQRLGGFEFDDLVVLSRVDIEGIMREPTPLHRFCSVTSENFHRAVALIASQYGGAAVGIWRGKPASGEVVYRFLQFHGVGQKIATMATNILARDFKVPMSDYRAIDVSVDVQVRRVFGRLGLISEGVSVNQVVQRARLLSPDFPGLLDLPAWDIGRQWCWPKAPICGSCHMHRACPSAVGAA